MKSVFIFCILLLVAAGCATPPEPGASPLIGKWFGEEEGVSGTSKLFITPSIMEFYGANTNEYLLGSYTLVESANPKQIIVQIYNIPTHGPSNTVANLIYELNGNTLKIAGHRPGSSDVPASFSDVNLRTIVFQRVVNWCGMP